MTNQGKHEKTADEIFKTELAALINRHSWESKSNTPDFILANYVVACLSAFTDATMMRDTCITPTPFVEANQSVPEDGKCFTGNILNS
jgi:hypothetical protein